jgi:hypothetical protein
MSFTITGVRQKFSASTLPMQGAVCPLGIPMDIEAKLENKLAMLFLDPADMGDAIALLNSYGTEPYEQESIRVRLAILKLAGPNPSIAELRKFTNAAKADYRDVLSWAEYPRQSRSWSAKGAKKQRLIEADLNEYQTWLNT